MRLPKNVAVLTLAICLPLLSVARAQEKKLEPVSISYASVTGTRAPLWIGKDMGIFEKHGLDAKLILISGGLPAVSALIAGDVQFIGTGGSVVAAAAARGAPLVIVATFGSIAYKLIGLPQLSSIQDLKGKVVGAPREALGVGQDVEGPRRLRSDAEAYRPQPRDHRPPAVVEDPPETDDLIAGLREGGHAGPLDEFVG